MTHIRIEKVSFGFAEPLFEEVSFSIDTYDRLGIVGNNGSGKSTLLKCIAGCLEPQEGRVICPKGVKFGFIEQGIPNPLLNLNFSDVLTDIIPEEEKPYMAWKVEATLDSFKAPMAIRQKPIHELSGGWQRLALISRLVLSNPDVLLLDEPTNHLDVSKIVLLEQWLNEQVYDIPLICISHDRSFLSNCTNKTLFLRGKKAHLFQYAYEQATQLLNESDHANEAKRSKEMKEMNRLKRSAHELRQIGVNNYSAAALKKSIQIAKRAEGIETQLTKIHKEEKRAIKLSNSGTQAKKLCELNRVHIRSPEGVHLFSIEKLTILQGERVIIFGENGSGKSQFLTHLYKASQEKELAKEEGITMSPSIKLAYIDQQISHLPLESSLHDYFNQALSLDSQRINSTLINAGFPLSMHGTKLASLSYGQRARVAFLALHVLQPNFYIMDEPTNHLDIAGQEQLESEIVEQEATSILVTHDRIFTKHIGTRFLMIENKRLVEIESPEVFYARCV